MPAASVAGALAAVAMQDLAGDEARPFEIQDRPDDVVDLTYTPDRMIAARPS
jgi:hypothetical protein